MESISRSVIDPLPEEEVCEFADHGEERTTLPPTMAEDHAELFDALAPLCEEAIDGITYQDPDDLRWEQLAEMGNECIVPAGFMRLQGSFSGTATTHTHQIDLALGLDVEMPSEVAADAMKQLSGGSSDGGPLRCRLVDSQEDRIMPKQHNGLWSSLAQFFWRDSQQGSRRATKELVLPLDLKAHKHEEQADPTEHAASSDLEEQLLMLGEERDQLRAQIEFLEQQHSEQAGLVEQLREHSEACLGGNRELSGQLAEREEEVRRLEALLVDTEQRVEAARTDVLTERSLRERLEHSLGSTRGTHEVLLDENHALKDQNDKLFARIAELETKHHEQAVSAAALEHELRNSHADQERFNHLNERLRASSIECDQLKEQLSSLQLNALSDAGGTAALQARIEELEAKVREMSGHAAEADVLRHQVQELATTAAEAESLRREVGKLAPLAAEVERLRREVVELSKYAAEAEALRHEVRELACAADEAEVLRSEADALRLEVRELSCGAAVTAEEAVEKARLHQELLDLRERHERLRDEYQRNGQATHAHAAAVERERHLHAEMDRLRQSAADNTQLELLKSQAQAEAQKLQSQVLNLQDAVERAHSEMTVAAAAKAAAEALASQAEADSVHLQREHGELLARAGALSAREQVREGEAQRLQEELQSAQDHIDSITSESSHLASELQRMRDLVLKEEQNAIQTRQQNLELLRTTEDVRTEASNIKLKHLDMEAQRAEREHDLAGRLQSAERELVAREQRVQRANADRDEAVRKLQEERSARAEAASKLHEEVHAAKEVRGQGLEEELIRLRGRCAALEAGGASGSFEQAASVDMSIPSAVCTGATAVPTGIHGASVVGSRAEPVTSWAPAGCFRDQAARAPPTPTTPTNAFPGPPVAGPTLSQTWSSIGSSIGVATGGSLGRSVKHVGTTTRVLGASGGISAMPNQPGSYRLPSRRVGVSANVAAARPSTASSIPMSHTPVGSVATAVPPSPASPRMPRHSRTMVAAAPIIGPPVLACAQHPVRINTVAGPVNAKMTVQIMGVRRLK